MIKVKDLMKQYGDNVVLKKIDLEVQPGEVISVIGPSGSGKSTFLRCINGLEELTAGHIHVDELDIADPNVNIDKLRQRVGMVFQSFNLFPHLTVIENIILAPVTLKKMTKEEAIERAKQLLAKVGLSEKGEVYPSSLSGGQKQRVAIARALAMDPEALLFDEPTSALDPELVKEVLDIIKKLKQEKNITMLIVSHEMKFVREISDKVIVLENSKILEIGSHQKIFENPSSARVKEFLNNI